MKMAVFMVWINAVAFGGLLFGMAVRPDLVPTYAIPCALSGFVNFMCVRLLAQKIAKLTPGVAG